MKNKDYVSNNLHLMEEWNWEKNNSLGLFPNKLTCGSSKSVWWKCKKCGYEWKTKISHRFNGSICKNCYHIALSTPLKENSLKELYPQIAIEWNYSKNSVSPDSVYPHSNKKYWWKCANGHEWQETPCHRVERNNSCPICSNRKVLQGYNDLATTNPALLSEWDWEKNNAINILPTEITYGCHVKVNWKCPKGHTWQSIVYSRTCNGENCPYCCKELRTSFPEKAIAFYIKKLFPNAIENYTDNSIGKYELDIYIPEIKLAVEYDGERWHKNVENDLNKDNICTENNISLIRIRESGCPNYTSSSYKTIIKAKNILSLENAISEIITITNTFSKNNNSISIDINRDTPLILENTLSQDKAKSIASTNLINEWNFEKNRNINPSFVSIYSNKKYWWKCSYGHEWFASAAHRSTGRNCPYCSNQKALKGYNDLLTLYPEIAAEWDYDLNTSLPTEIVAKSNKKFWWKCSKCGYSWETQACVRTSMKCGCPKCKCSKLSQRSSKKVINITTQTIFDSIKIASQTLNINASAISNCCRGVTNTAGGYQWEYFKSDK